jgi:formate C-acetyltransferase
LHFTDDITIVTKEVYTMEMKNEWKYFLPGNWCEKIDVRDFIQKNYTPYIGNEDFLSAPTDRTNRVMAAFEEKLKEEREKGGVIGVDTETVTSLLNYPAAYLCRDDELIVGLQTGAPLVREVNPFGGIRMARSACRAYGYELSDKIEQEFNYRTTHNDGVFRVYTDTMRAMRHTGILTGLPDAYGRGRIIGDYRRIALYGMDFLIEEKKKDKA